MKVIFGDLNFRLNSDIDFPKCVDIIQSGEMKELVKRDDLYIFGGSDPLIRNFMEGALLFAPTYKYLCGTNVYDKERMPAWCDRVLWQAKQGSMGQIYYNRAEINLSDHKPVVAVFEAKIKTVDKILLETFKQQIAHQYTEMRKQQMMNIIQ